MSSCRVDEADAETDRDNLRPICPYILGTDRSTFKWDFIVSKTILNWSRPISFIIKSWWSTFRQEAFYSVMYRLLPNESFWERIWTLLIFWRRYLNHSSYLFNYDFLFCSYVWVVSSLGIRFPRGFHDFFMLGC